ncbi:hypothetical protein F5Y01DRAFT_111921 [Xylaria sp. FL0043]|nr:hypothetical protein F5Y01DRAFT_111921 [Xylaria sp. FL0043]
MNPALGILRHAVAAGCLAQPYVIACSQSHCSACLPWCRNSSCRHEQLSESDGRERSCLLEKEKEKEKKTEVVREPWVGH